MKDENDDCVDQRGVNTTTAVPVTTPACEPREIDFENLFDETMEKDLDVQALNEATRDTFLGSQKVPMSNIVRRFENSKTVE